MIYKLMRLRNKAHLALSIAILPLLLGCKYLTALSLSKSSASLNSTDPGRFDWTDYLKPCAQDLKNLPYLFAAHAYTGESVTLWWRVFRREEVILAEQGNTAIVIEVMGAIVEKGYPDYVDEQVRKLTGNEEFKRHLAHLNGAQYISEHFEEEARRKFLSVCQSQGFESAYALYTELLRFVFEQYRDRYALSEEVLNGMHLAAQDAAPHSLYISARDKKTNEILGTFRLIRAPYGRRLEVSNDLARTVADDSGFFGPLVEEMFPYRWNGHDLGAAQSDEKIADSERNFPDETIGKAHHIINYTVASLYNNIIYQDLYSAEKKHTKVEFTALPLEDSLHIKLPREAPLKKSVAESNGELARSKRVSVSYGSGELIELGSLAIKRGVASEVKVEIYRQMILALEQAVKGKHTVLWNQNFRPRLYEKLGFQTIKENIEKNGLKYAVQMAKPEDYIQALKKIVTKERDGEKEEKETTAVACDSIADLEKSGNQTTQFAQHRAESLAVALDCLGGEALQIQKSKNL